MDTKHYPQVIDGTYRASRDPWLLAVVALEAIVVGSVIAVIWYL
jgi:hypothetical protein